MLSTDQIILHQGLTADAGLSLFHYNALLRTLTYEFNSFQDWAHNSICLYSQTLIFVSPSYEYHVILFLTSFLFIFLSKFCPKFLHLLNFCSCKWSVSNCLPAHMAVSVISWHQATTQSIPRDHDSVHHCHPACASGSFCNNPLFFVLVYWLWFLNKPLVGQRLFLVSALS